MSTAPNPYGGTNGMKEAAGPDGPAAGARTDRAAKETGRP